MSGGFNGNGKAVCQIVHLLRETCNVFHFPAENPPLSENGSDSAKKTSGLSSPNELGAVKQMSSLVAKYQEQAMTEKQSRVSAQLQVLEKV